MFVILLTIFKSWKLFFRKMCIGLIGTRVTHSIGSWVLRTSAATLLPGTSWIWSVRAWAITPSVVSYQWWLGIISMARQMTNLSRFIVIWVLSCWLPKMQRQELSCKTKCFNSLKCMSMSSIGKGSTWCHQG